MKSTVFIRTNLYIPLIYIVNSIGKRYIQGLIRPVLNIHLSCNFISPRSEGILFYLIQDNRCVAGDNSALLI